MRTLLVLSAFCVNLCAADSNQVYSAPATVTTTASDQVYASAHSTASAPVYAPPPVAAPQVFAPPPLPAAPVFLPTVTYVTFPTVYVPVFTTVTTVVDAPPKLELFCPRRCFVRLNRFGVEVCRCPQDDDNNLGLALAFTLFGHGRSGRPTTKPYD